MTATPSIDALLKKYPIPRRKTGICFAEKSGKQEIIEALAERGQLASHIALILREEYGFSVAPQTVNRHLRGECACPKK